MELSCSKSQYLIGTARWTNFKKIPLASSEGPQSCGVSLSETSNSACFSLSAPAKAESQDSSPWSPSTRQPYLLPLMVTHSELNVIITVTIISPIL